jgi:hypothetical protein
MLIRLPGDEYTVESRLTSVQRSVNRESPSSVNTPGESISSTNKSTVCLLGPGGIVHCKN